MTTSALLLALTALACVAYALITLHIITHGRAVSDLSESLTRADIAAAIIAEHRDAIAAQDTLPACPIDRSTITIEAAERPVSASETA